MSSRETLRFRSCGDLGAAVRFVGRTVSGLLVLLAAVVPVAGQTFDPGPPGPYVIDVRGVITSLPNAFSLLLLSPLETVAPLRGRGIELGAHFYPVSFGVARLGVGASLLRASGSAIAVRTEGGANPPLVDTRVTVIAPQVSLNFGSGDGWSYVSAGFGLGKTEASLSQVGAVVSADAGWGSMLSYGGGARWFLKPRLAFGLDLRVHQFPGKTTGTGVLPRTTLVSATAGISLR
jgi:hypothetical protein